MPAPKHFAPKQDVAAAPEIEFSVAFARDGIAETHEFTARPRLTYGDTLGLVKNQEDGARVLPFLDRLIRRSLANDDGVPEKWRATIVDGGFDAPDGKHHDLVDLDQFTAFEAGSSRRRWVQLMQHDDDVTVEFEQIMGVFEYLTAEAGSRPT